MLGLLVKDPRLVLPKKKSFNKCEAQTNELTCLSSLDKTTSDHLKTMLRDTVLSRSTLWDRQLIETLNKSKQTTHQINKIRSKFLIPGSDVSNAVTSFSKIPVILIQNSLNNNMASVQGGNLFTGWDIILPNSWAMPFWLPLIHMGARAIGQNELNYLLFESGNIILQ